MNGSITSWDVVSPRFVLASLHIIVVARGAV